MIKKEKSKPTKKEKEISNYKLLFELHEMQLEYLTHFFINYLKKYGFSEYHLKEFKVLKDELMYDLLCQYVDYVYVNNDFLKALKFKKKVIKDKLKQSEGKDGK